VAYWLSLNSGLSVTEKNEQDDLGYFACLWLFGNQIESQGLKGFKKETSFIYTGNIGWAGVRTKYFLSSLIPQGVRAEAIKFEKLSEHSLSAGLKRSLSPGSSDLYTIYFGPIEYKRLKALGVGLERVCDTGWRWIQPISRLILQLLLLLHRVFPNYGVVIILFSIIMKVLFFPLSYLSLKSMKEMQKLQPQMAELKERFKGDPARLNRETMELYRRHKINPLGGCLPMLIQIPIFFALYNVLRSMIELRGAGFIFWIRDISQRDPYLILPILMGITMFIQQKISTKDPRQKGMMYLMPAVMTFIFLSFPAGLNLYFLITNLLSIGETIFVQYKTKEVMVKA